MNNKFSTEILKKIPIFHADTTILNAAIADHLKQSEILTQPENVDIIKTGVAKRMPPEDKDWFYKRAASVFRSVVLNTMKNPNTDPITNAYIQNTSCEDRGVGTHYFARKYSTRQNRGVRPSKFAKGSTGHIKGILEDFTKCGWFKKCEVGYKASDEGLKVMREFVDKVRE